MPPKPTKQVSVTGGRTGRAHSMFSIFHQDKDIEHDLKETYDLVTSIKKASKGGKKGILESLSIVTTGDKKQGEEQVKKESRFWKSGEQMAKSSEIAEHEDSPLHSVLEHVSGMQSAIALHHAKYETKTYKDLCEEGNINKLVSQDYPAMEKDNQALQAKRRELENVKNRYTREKNRRENAKNDPELADQLCIKENKLHEDMTALQKDVESAKDKLATSLYGLKASEKEYSEDILQYLLNFQKYLQDTLEEVNKTVPQINNIINTTKNRKVFGEDLETHLRTSQVEIAIPLKIAAYGLSGRLKEEGLFRVGPGLLSLKRLKASIDAGVSAKDLYLSFQDPHVLTAIIKSYLRELPSPLFGATLVEEWKKVAAITNRNQRLQQTKETLAKLPKANQDNIGFLCQFLAKLVDQKEHNKMNVDNVIIIFGPNLLWESNLDQENTIAVNINNVLEILINEAEHIFPHQIVSMENDQIMEDFQEYQKMSKLNAFVLDEDCDKTWDITSESQDPPSRKSSKSGSPTPRKSSDSKSSSPVTPKSRKSSDSKGDSPTARKSSDSKPGHTIKEGIQSTLNLFPRKSNLNLVSFRRGTSFNSTETAPDSPS